MKWKKERDLLIAQTVAFVQSVTRKSTELERVQARAQEAEARIVDRPVESIPLNEPAETEWPVETTAVARPSPARHSEFREEIRGRVAAFRAHQEHFNRNRDEYYNAVLAKVRSAAEHPSMAPGDQPAKH